jgi:hypothetical protein
MTYLRHLSRLAVAATLVVAAMLLAPSGALAHAGHDHGPVKIERAVPAAHAPGTVHIQQEFTREIIAVQGSLFVTASSEPTGGKGTTSCATGCCHSAGHGCCAAALPTLLTVGPAPTRTAPIFALFLLGPGLSPGALPEPPRYLV